jgi:transposase-like protein
MTELVAAVAESAKENGASIAALCRTVGLSRSTFYRCARSQPSPESAETDLREAIQQIALEFSCYGYRRITAQLARDGWSFMPA